MPAVHIGAYVSQQGERAWVLANGTDVKQSVRWRHAGSAYSRNLLPRGLGLIKSV